VTADPKLTVAAQFTPTVGGTTAEYRSVNSRSLIVIVVSSRACAPWFLRDPRNPASTCEDTSCPPTPARLTPQRA